MDLTADEINKNYRILRGIVEMNLNLDEISLQMQLCRRSTEIVGLNSAREFINFALNRKIIGFDVEKRKFYVPK